ncbi:hypothetical protein NP493_311g02082 [Ridgeia piscesae]|uniref:Gem-associated protein 5 TPR domain-containing protein n=1 Tax=Ridgeia piscesae TaxID=27915 RepID=A0AAD9L5P8_RIDPI|nr:hypothetical protein NP493_311g02082 [Ridgeia piscesae]
MEQFTVLELFKGSPASALRTAADKGQLNDWLMALAPMASPQHWKQLCGQYARQLEEEGLYQKAVSYYLAVHQVYDAINMLRRNSLYK